MVVKRTLVYTVSVYFYQRTNCSAPVCYSWYSGNWNKFISVV